jgi:hypothetical protein
MRAWRGLADRDNFEGGRSGAVAVLRELGFTVPDKQ